MEDKEWVLKNVEEICADTRDVDEVCMALEHSTIFATEIIQNLTKTILDLQQELSKSNEKLKKIEEYINDLQQENEQLKKQKNDGINYIKEHIKYECDDSFNGMQFYSYHLYDFDKKDLLRMLGEIE